MLTLTLWTLLVVHADGHTEVLGHMDRSSCLVSQATYLEEGAQVSVCKPPQEVNTKTFCWNDAPAGAPCLATAEDAA